MSITLELVRNALSQVIDPNTDKDFISSKSAKNIKINGVDVSLDIELGYPAKSQINILWVISSNSCGVTDFFMG